MDVANRYPNNAEICGISSFVTSSNSCSFDFILVVVPPGALLGIYISAKFTYL